jgi:hypothetical protein
VAGGMKQDLTPFLHQTVHGSGYQHVVGGDWEHNVSGQNKDKYGTWDTDSGAWTGHMASVAWKVDGNIGFKSPTMTIDCPDVSIKGAKISTESGFIKDFSHGSLETFGTKNAIGVQQLDAVSIVLGTWVAKMEAGGIGACALAVKTENDAFEAKNLGCSFKALGAKIWNAGVKVANRGTVIDTDGFKKI